jgi:transcriptional regulator with XRE-family HTH domain
VSPRKRAAGQERDDPAHVLGPRIRARRQQLGLTLQQVAKMASLSHPFLSQVERGLARPSVITLQQIANTLGTTTYMLLAPKAGPVRLVRRGEGVMPSGDDRAGAETRRSLAAEGDRVRGVEVCGPPATWGPNKTTQPGQVLIYVADGGIEADVAGKLYQLEAGDTLIFDGRLPHDVRNLAGPETRYLSIWVS